MEEQLELFPEGWAAHKDHSEYERDVLKACAATQREQNRLENQS